MQVWPIWKSASPVRISVVQVAGVPSCCWPRARWLGARLLGASTRLAGPLGCAGAAFLRINAARYRSGQRHFRSFGAQAALILAQEFPSVVTTFQFTSAQDHPQLKVPSCLAPKAAKSACVRDRAMETASDAPRRSQAKSRADLFNAVPVSHANRQKSGRPTGCRVSSSSTCPLTKNSALGMMTSCGPTFDPGGRGTEILRHRNQTLHSPRIIIAFADGAFDQARMMPETASFLPRWLQARIREPTDSAPATHRKA